WPEPPTGPPSSPTLKAVPAVHERESSSIWDDDDTAEEDEPPILPLRPAAALEGEADGEGVVDLSAPSSNGIADVAPPPTERLTLKPPVSRDSGTLHSVAFSPDGARVAAGSGDALVLVWDAATGKELLALRGHSKEVGAVVFSPDGKTLASGSQDKL